jgi:hypothetical protein
VTGAAERTAELLVITGELLMVRGRHINRVGDAGLSDFVQDLQILFDLPIAKKHTKVVLADCPFDAQLLSFSAIYRKSRKFYLELGGGFSARACSMMRSLSAQDLFADHIEYSPLLSDLSPVFEKTKAMDRPGGPTLIQVRRSGLKRGCSRHLIPSNRFQIVEFPLVVIWISPSAFPAEPKVHEPAAASS